MPKFRQNKIIQYRNALPKVSGTCLIGLRSHPKPLWNCIYIIKSSNLPIRYTKSRVIQLLIVIT